MKYNRNNADVFIYKNRISIEWEAKEGNFFNKELVEKKIEIPNDSANIRNYMPDVFYYDEFVIYVAKDIEYKLHFKNEKISYDFMGELLQSITHIQFEELEDKVKPRQFVEYYNSKYEQIREIMKKRLKKCVEKKVEKTNKQLTAPKSVEEQMKFVSHLKELLDSGVITEEEYKAKKRELLKVGIKRY